MSRNYNLLYNTLKLTQESVDNIYLYSAGMDMFIGEFQIDKNGTLNYTKVDGVSLKSLEPIILKAGLYEMVTFEDEEYLKLSTKQYMRNLEHKNQVNNIFKALVESFSFVSNSPTDINFYIKLNHNILEYMTTFKSIPSKENEFILKQEYKSDICMKHFPFMRSCTYPFHLVLSVISNSKSPHNLIKVSDIMPGKYIERYKNKNMRVMIQHVQISLNISNPLEKSYILDKPYSQSFKDIIDVLFAILNHSNSTHFIRRYIWIIKEVLWRLFFIIGDEKTPENINTCVQATYDLFKELLKECKEEELHPLPNIQYNKAKSGEPPITLDPSLNFTATVHVLKNYIIHRNK